MSETFKGGFRRKAFFPLESNPDIFNEVIRGLGVSPSLAFVDVLSVDDPEVLAFTPRPALALVMVCPGSPAYEARKKELDSKKDEYVGKGEDEPAIWWRQTIYNACGLYGILHAISNGLARQYIRE